MDLRVEVGVHASAREAWVVLGERFADIGEWAAPLTAASLEGDLHCGAVRTCYTARFGPVPAGTIRERLIELDTDSMSFAYEAIDGMPGFIERAVTRWSVHSLGDDRCVVRPHATLTLRGPIVLLSFRLKRRSQSDGARVLDELC